MWSIDLTGRTALVTGSSRGIGYAIAERLLAAGASVVINGRTASDHLRHAFTTFAAVYPERVHVCEGDVGNPAQATRIVRYAFDIGKRLDILVNNAGVLRDALIGMISETEMEDTLRTNVMGAIHMTQAAARLMARSKPSSIINISSIIGTHGNRGQLVYGASKAGVIGVTLSAAKELAAQGIRVNAIAPGFIRTAMIEHLSADLYQQRLSSIAMGRIGEPEDVANLALFLASDLSTYVTGQIIGVDGGMMI
jgi:3-oxoacyl-[acyl-carrier protein] reductase